MCRWDFWSTSQASLALQDRTLNHYPAALVSCWSSFVCYVHFVLLRGKKMLFEIFLPEKLGCFFFSPESVLIGRVAEAESHRPWFLSFLPLTTPLCPKNVDIFLNIHVYKTGYRGSKMAQWIKVPATQPDDPSSSLWSHVADGENELQKAVLQHPHTLCGTRRHTQKNV